MIARARTCILTLTVAFLAALPIAARADVVDSFASSIHVRVDGSAEVTETILYDFGAQEHHGIFRDIPVYYVDDSGAKRNVLVDAIAVTDGKNVSYPFTTEHDGDNLHIKIGDPDKLVSGKQTYVISYVAHGVVGFFDGYDELYWNVTGNEWLSPILKSSARVYAPATTTQSACYIGAQGSTESCPPAKPIQGEAFGLAFESGRGLEPHEGITVAVGWPKGFVTQPSPPSAFLKWVRILGPFLIPLVTFFVLLRMWWKHGRDEAGHGTIIPEYDAPKDITPAMASFILHERVIASSLAATLIELAVRGYLTIHREETKTLGIFSSVQYRFDRTKPADSSLSADESTLFSALFKDRDSVTSDDLKSGGDLVKAQQTIKSDLAKQMVAEGYYRANPSVVKGMYIGVGIVLAAAGFFVAIGAQVPWLFLSGLLTAVIIIVFGLIMPAKTKKGTLAKEQILGLKDYLQIAEKNRLDFHNAPEKSPELFEKLLPYAILLGVSSAWAKEFEGLQTVPPSWYSGGSYAAFAPTVFADDMNSMSAAVTTLATPVSSGGGSGGGGFSGGGFGGGGGGSW